MWNVALPDIGDIDAQLDAGLRYANGQPVYHLAPGERAGLHALYALYDTVLGEPNVLLQPPGLANCANAIHGAYGQVQKGGRLHALREQLLGAVSECPLCGSGPATTLDHHLPKAVYRALAINPRNLVPSCQPCNRAKGTLLPAAGAGMIHAYYQVLPPVEFFVADVTYAGGALAVLFRIDGAALPPLLAARLSFQLGQLDLNKRYPDAINIFLFSLKPALDWLRASGYSRALFENVLRHMAEGYSVQFGLNHWRTALVRGLLVCDAFLVDPWTYFDNPPAGLAAT